MRFVDRAKISLPSVLADDNIGNKEKIEAIEFYQKAISNQLLKKDKTKSKSKKKAFEFKVYKHDLVKKALEQLFHGKCAYCESRYAGIHPVDIEHWRPKGAVMENESGTLRSYGYYWLAATWDNLFPSCIDCNRLRKHYDFLERKELILGKGNWFPLENNNKRATVPGEELNEEPLLLNPCIDNPDNYFEFHEEGVIKPKFLKNGQPDIKAKSSIQFYALNRTELVLDRLERIRIIQQKMYVIKQLAKCLDKVSTDQDLEIIIQDLLSHQLYLLRSFEKPDQPFSLMAKQMIDNFIEIFRD